MTSWEDQFKELKIQFISRSASRLAEIENLCESLSQNPTDQNLMGQIKQHFHWLAGSGGTYGFNEISNWGNHGEELCDQLLAADTAAGAETLNKLRSALSAIKQIFAQNPSSTTINPEESTAVQAPSAPPFSLELAKVNQATDSPTVWLLAGDPNTLGFLQNELSPHKLHLEYFDTISATKTALNQKLPNAIIISVPLADGSAYELIEQLRSEDLDEKVIVIILGQQSDFLDKVQAIKSGADAFFELPAEQPELTKKLLYLLDRDKPEKYRILSIEDDPDQAAFIKLTVESAGYKFAHLSDPKKFEEVFLQFEPDLVLLDVMLGDMTGFDLAKYIRQHDRFATIPIIFLTTQNKVHMHIRSARAGCDDHLIKPAVPQLLIATIAGRLERSRAIKRLIDRDGLTQCLVYGSFMEKAQKAVLANPAGNIALMMLDIDDLKQINNNFGFIVGDRVIANIAQLLLKGFRNTETIARYDNDQFAIILEHLNAQQLQNLASQVISAVGQSQHQIQGKIIQATASCGISLLESGMTLEEWLDTANNALKTAKMQGKNQVLIKPPKSTSGSPR